MGKMTAKPKSLSKTTKVAKSPMAKKSSRAAVKSTVRKSTNGALPHYDAAPAYVQETLEAFAESDRRLKADPSEARRVLIKMGLMTKGGKLTKRYGG